MVGSVLLGVGNSWQIFAPPPWPSCTALSLSSIFGQYSHQYIVINIRPIFSSIQGQYCHQYIVINFVNLTIFDNMSIIISNSGQIFTPPRPSLVQCSLSLILVLSLHFSTPSSSTLLWRPSGESIFHNYYHQVGPRSSLSFCFIIIIILEWNCYGHKTKWSGDWVAG